MKIKRKDLSALTFGMVSLALSFAALEACAPMRAIPPNGGVDSPLAVEPSSPPAANGDLLKISSIDGIYNSNHSMELYVHPGDVVNLSADYFLAAQNFAPAQAPVEDFNWRSTISAQDFCEASLNQNCLTKSNFQLTSYGVAFYVPANMPENVQIQVRGADRSMIDAQGKRIYDTVTLHNMDFGSASGPATLITDPAQYSASTLDPDLALTGMGHWVSLEGVRYFAPYTYINTTIDQPSVTNVAPPSLAPDSEWTPYRHGYWAWESSGQWTWISYDPWGWMTDHYGTWRHHGVYGWIWSPFDTMTYQPHCVTWFGNSALNGWLPFHAPMLSVYRLHGEAEGFDDGYWAGLQAGSLLAEQNQHFHPGFAMVNHRDITSVDLSLVVLNSTANLGVFQQAFAQNLFFPIPGGDRANARSFVENGATRPGTLTELDMIHGKGGASFQVPHAVYPVPAESSAFLIKLAQAKHTVPLGSVIQSSANSVHVLYPSSNGRSLVAPPMLHNASGAPIGVVAIHSAHPLVAQAGNPLAVVRPEPHAIPAIDPHELPAFNPHQPTPGVRVPRSQTTPPSEPRAVVPSGPRAAPAPAPTQGAPSAPAHSQPPNAAVPHAPVAPAAPATHAPANPGPAPAVPTTHAPVVSAPPAPTTHAPVVSAPPAPTTHAPVVPAPAAPKPPQSGAVAPAPATATAPTSASADAHPAAARPEPAPAAEGHCKVGTPGCDEHH